MATTTTDYCVLSQGVLCPPPLSIQKKSRRATFRQRIFRKSTSSQNSDQYVFGPLDDIIDEIKSDIWGSPPDCGFDSCIFYGMNTFKAPSLMWAVTPLPVSRIPSEQPLMVRKNRHSHSSASLSSLGDPMVYSRHGSQEETMDGGPVGSPSTEHRTPWPVLDPETSDGAAPTSLASEFSIQHHRPTAQQTLEHIAQSAEVRPDTAKRRPSRLRLFTNGIPRLRRRDTSSSNCEESTTPTLTHAVSPGAYADEEEEEEVDAKEPSDEAVEAYIRKNARNGTKFGSIITRIAKRLPPPADCEHDSSDGRVSSKSSSMPTTLRAAVNVFMEKKIITEEIQDIDIAIDIEGVLHNRMHLPDTTIDVIFVVDNGYYVTKACLEKALDAVNGALYHLIRGDRVALYSTHCTHHAVTGNRPDLHYPIRPYSADLEDLFRDLTTKIAQYGTQVWEPPRPNPSMTEVVLGIARSLENQDMKKGRTHMILLSPAAYVLHDVSKHFPDLCVHQINAATLPFRRNLEPQDTTCVGDCCKNVFVSNWSAYQSVPSRIKRILKNARSEKPIGELTDLSIDLRTRDGCELLECHGAKDISYLRLGQLHTLYACIRVTKTRTQAVDLESKNPVFNSSLDVTDLRQQLLNAVTVGALKVHLLDIQVLYRTSLHTTDCWNYTETPLLIIRELGGLASPSNAALEVQKRRYFRDFNQIAADAARDEACSVLLKLPRADDQARKLVECMIKEIECHQKTQVYEDMHRQRLPLCPGPIEIESTHEWLVDLWDKKKSRRKGVAVATERVVTEVVDGVQRRPERLG